MNYVEVIKRAEIRKFFDNELFLSEKYTYEDITQIIETVYEDLKTRKELEDIYE